MQLPTSENCNLPMMVWFTVGYPTYLTKETAEERRDAPGRLEANKPYLLLNTSEVDPTYGYYSYRASPYTLYEVVNIDGAKLFLCIHSSLEEALREKYIIPIEQESI